MLTRLSFFLLTLLSSTVCFSAGIKGTIKTDKGEPLPFATIYIEENGTGTVTNEEGYYEVNLGLGTYTIVYKFLGYESVVRTVTINRSAMEVIDVVLKEQTLELNTVEINDGREDPAYTIMRKAIAKAGYHRQQIESYTGKVYIKGSGRLMDSPFLFRKAIEKEGIDSTTAFVSESVSEISYQRPNIYKEKIISIREQGDANSTSPNQYINGSFYEPNVGESISPLSPKAFAYYRFEFLGSYHEQDYEVNKIKVTPRSRGEGVYEGIISIVEDWWNIHSLQLVTYKLGIGFNIQQVYAPIENRAWLPVTQKFDIDAKFFGFKFVYNYLATVSDYKIELNPDLDVDFKVIDEKIETDLAAEIEKSQKEKKLDSFEEKLASGEELTRKDLRKLLKEYEKEERKQQEEPKANIITQVEVDSNANNRDTLFWQNIRPVPLTAYELKTYQKADSLAVVEKIEQENKDSTENRKENKILSNAFGIVLGYNIKLGENTRLIYDSPLEHFNFNTVEGYHFGTDLRIRTKIGKRKVLKIGGMPRYQLGPDKLIGKGYIDYQFGKEYRPTNFLIEGGRYISQINEENPIDPSINAIYTWFFADNYMKLYEKDFLKARLKSRTSDNLLMEFSGEWAKRRSLENAASADPLIGERSEFTPNTPNNLEIGQTPFEENTAITLKAGFEWRPWQTFNIRNNKKYFVNNAPIFLANYRKGLGDVSYDLIELGSKYSWNRWDGSRLDLKVMFGSFVNNDSLSLVDFKHFPGNRTVFVTSDPVESFRLLDYYENSTRDKFVQAHAHYQFRKLLFTQIPEVWLVGLKENLFANYLATPTNKNYLEVGYGLDNIFKIFRIEAIAAFKDFEYDSFGIRIGISTAIGVNISEDGEDNSVTVGF